jgi:hypothetical protein
MASNVSGAAIGAGDMLQIECRQPCLNTAGLLRCINKDMCWNHGVIQHQDANQHIAYITTPNQSHYPETDERCTLWHKHVQESGGSAMQWQALPSIPMTYALWKRDEHPIESERGVPPLRYQDLRNGYTYIRMYYGQWPNSPEWQQTHMSEGHTHMMKSTMKVDADYMCTYLDQQLRSIAACRDRSAIKKLAAKR